MAKVLIVYGSGEGQTEKVADFIGERLRKQKHDVDVLRGKHLPKEFDIEHYGAIIVAASVRMMKYQHSIVDFARKYHARLDAVPSAFVSVSMSEASDGFQQEWLDHFIKDTGWKPARFASFAGALMYQEYDFATRLVMKQISKKSGLTTDTSKNHEFTDWEAVGRFAEEFAAALVEPVAGTAD